MEDLERYGDYNDYEDDEPKKKSPIGLILKILIGVVCFAVIALLGARLILFNYYPDSIKNIYFNDKLTAYYNSTDGKIGAKTQNLSAPYDDPDVGNFFCDNLIVIPGINQLQISLRYNVSLIAAIKEAYGVDLSADAELFEFSLSIIPIGDSDADPIATGSLSYSKMESFMMYRYYKLVFDDVQLTVPDCEEVWIRLEIRLKDVDKAKPYHVLIYEDTAKTPFDDYKLSRKERPAK
ncbi:MAG: hypothetical protein J6V09_03935 [Clostridia bacterium]|nr:hypothetical protein [Clostridia bacterium]